MAKYECRCAANSPCRCVIECSPGIAPFRCCLTGESSCNWRRVEDQKPELPEWCKVGAWVWFSGAKDIGYEPGYLKITDVGYNGIENVINAEGDGIISMPLSVVKEARLRPWNDDELKSKVGKVFEDDAENPTLCFRYQRGNETLHFAGKIMSSESLAESDWKLDGSPCGVLEHKNEQGDWVK